MRKLPFGSGWLVVGSFVAESFRVGAFGWDFCCLEVSVWELFGMFLGTVGWEFSFGSLWLGNVV